MTGKQAIPARLGLPLACLVMALLAVAARYAGLALDAIRFPYELDYGEGIVWQQMRMMLAGHAYAPLGTYPAIVFHYPPLYHLASGAMAGLTGMDQLAAGRLVSVLCTLAGAGFAGLVTAALAPAGKARGYRIGGAAAAVSLLGTRPFLVWSVVMRVDMLFVALSFAGLWLGIRALRQPRAVHGAALCLAAAIFTKQTAIAAPLAVFAVLLVVRPRTALAGIATGMAVAVAGLLAAMAWSDGQFLNHIVAYNINRFLALRGWEIPEIFAKHLGLLLPALAAIAWRARAADWRSDPAQAGFAMVLLHLALATAMLGLVFKSGSAVNYFLEWMVLVAILAGVALGEFVSGAPSRLRAAVPWLLMVQAMASFTMLESDYPKRAAQRADYARIEAAMRAAPGPIISDDMVLLLRAGQPVVIEPSIFAELSGRGKLDDRDALTRLARHEFAFILTEGFPGDPVFDSRYTPAMTQAILRAYPQVLRLANFTLLRFPAGPLPGWASALALNAPPAPAGAPLPPAPSAASARSAAASPR